MIITNLNSSTRSEDLNKVDNSRSQDVSENALRKREALLASLYEQIKDPILEKLRIQLIDQLRILNSQDPSITQLDRDGAFNVYIQIQNKIKAYTSTHQFQANIAQKVAKVAGEDMANSFYEKGVNSK